MKEQWHWLVLFQMPEGEKKLDLGVQTFTQQQRVKLFCLYHDLQHREETVWGSSLYIEVNNREDSVKDNCDDNRSDHRISPTRDVSGEGERIGTAEVSQSSGIQSNFQKIHL